MPVRRPTTKRAPGSKHQHPAVQGHVREPRDAGRRERLQGPQHPCRQEPAKDCAGHAVEQRFGQTLTQEIGPARAERDAHALSRLARRCAHEQQVGHVQTRNQQQQPDRAKQNPQRPPEWIGGDPCARRVQRRAETGIVLRVLSLEVLHDGHEIRRRRFDGHARLDPANRRPLETAAIGIRPPDEGHEHLAESSHGLPAGTRRRQCTAGCRASASDQ